MHRDLQQDVGMLNLHLVLKDAGMLTLHQVLQDADMLTLHQVLQEAGMLTLHKVLQEIFTNTHNFTQLREWGKSTVSCRVHVCYY